MRVQGLEGLETVLGTGPLEATTALTTSGFDHL